MRALGLVLAAAGCTGSLQGEDDAGLGLDAHVARPDGAVLDTADAPLHDGAPPDDLGGGGEDAPSDLDAGSDPPPFDGGPPDPCRVPVEVPSGCAAMACRQVQRQMGTTCSTLGYLEASPAGYGAGPVPLLVFLHGLNQAGNGTSELERIDDFGIPRIIADGGWSESRPFLVLSPQHSGIGPCFTAEELRDFLDFAYRAYDVDRSRVYVTGLSCGGIGLWNYLGAYGDSQGLAGAVPVCGDGRGPWSTAGCAMGSVPIWAFHGDADDVVSVEGTRVPVLGLQACDPRPDVEMVIYPGVGHDSWSATYDGSGGHDIYAWMLAHRR
jgi:pimeloyl-ACP methyl ester carboxylesterase